MTDIQLEQVLPGDIERRSFEIIQEELSLQGIQLEPENERVVKRAIHTTADFGGILCSAFGKRISG